MMKRITRYGWGIQAAAPFYEEGVAPYLDLRKRVVLPARGLKGSKENKKRALIVAAALHQEKVRRLHYCPQKRKRGTCKLCKTAVTLRPNG